MKLKFETMGHENLPVGSSVGHNNAKSYRKVTLQLLGANEASWNSIKALVIEKLCNELVPVIQGSPLQEMTNSDLITVGLIFQPLMMMRLSRTKWSRQLVETPHRRNSLVTMRLESSTNCTWLNGSWTRNNQHDNLTLHGSNSLQRASWTPCLRNAREEICPHIL